LLLLLPLTQCLPWLLLLLLLKTESSSDSGT
jgi:hypothetical protein